MSPFVANKSKFVQVKRKSFQLFNVRDGVKRKFPFSRILVETAGRKLKLTLESNHKTQGRFKHLTNKTTK